MAYVHIPQVCKAMHESHMRVFDHWKRIWTPYISHFPRSYAACVMHAQSELKDYNALQYVKADMIRRVVATYDQDLPGFMDRYKKRHPEMVPGVVRKTEDDFWEVELTRSDNLDHCLPLADRRRPWRQRIYDD